MIFLLASSKKASKMWYTGVSLKYPNSGNFFVLAIMSVIWWQPRVIRHGHQRWKRLACNLTIMSPRQLCLLHAVFLTVPFSFKLNTLSKAKFTAHIPIHHWATLMVKKLCFSIGLTSCFGSKWKMSVVSHNSSKSSLSYDTPVSSPISHKVLPLWTNSVRTSPFPIFLE